MAEQISVLRTFRDTYLLDSALGTAFADAYYRISPPIADAVATSPLLATTVRVALTPIVLMAHLLVLLPKPLTLILVTLIVLAGICVLAKRHSRETTKQRS